MEAKTVNSVTIGVKQRASFDARYNRSSSRVGALENSRSDSVPDLVASDTSTNESNLGVDLGLTRAVGTPNKPRGEIESTMTQGTVWQEQKPAPVSLSTLSPGVQSAPPQPRISPGSDVEGVGELGESATSASLHAGASTTLPTRISSPVPRLGNVGNRRMLLQKASSVPVMSSSPQSQNLEPAPRSQKKLHASELLQTGDAPNRSRAASISSEGATKTILGQNSQMHTFLDALIFDAKNGAYHKPSPGAGYRKRVEQRRAKKSTSQQPVGRAPDRHQERVVVDLPNNGPRRNPSSESFSVQSSAGTRVSFHSSAGTRSLTSGSYYSMGSLSRNSLDRSVEISSAESAAERPSRHSGAAPIAWQRKERVRQGRRPMTRSQSMQGDGAHLENGLSPRMRYDGNLSSGILNTFLERESRHGRPTKARSISGDPRATEEETISIAISDGGDKAKTFEVGALEAKMIQQILEASAQRKGSDGATSDPPRGSKYDYVASSVPLSTPTSNTERVSTRGSVVELSPPLGAGDLDLKSYLEQGRGVQPHNSSAYTVAGYQDSTSYQGERTNASLDRHTPNSVPARDLWNSPLFVDGRSTRRAPTQLRQQLSRMSSVPNLGSAGDSASIGALRRRVLISNNFIRGPHNYNNDDPVPEADEMEDTARIAQRTSDLVDSSTGIWQDQGQSISSGGLPTVQRSRDMGGLAARGKVNSQVRRSVKKPAKDISAPSSITPKRVRNTRENSSEIMRARPRSTERPTNRRNLMVKMNSVPARMSIDAELVSPLKSRGLRLQRSFRGNKSSKQSKSPVPSERVRRGRKPANSDCSASDRPQSSVRHLSDSSNSTFDFEIDSDTFTSSSKQVEQSPRSTTPEENSASNRNVVQDPVRRSGPRKVKSATKVEEPSAALVELYEGNPRLQGDSKLKSPQKSGGKKKGTTAVPKESTDETCFRVNHHQNDSAIAFDSSLNFDKVTLSDLPRHGAGKAADELNALTSVSKLKSPALLDSRASDIADRFKLVERIKSLTPADSPSDAIKRPHSDAMLMRKQEVGDEKIIEQNGQVEVTIASKPSNGRPHQSSRPGPRRTLKSEGAKWRSMPNNLGGATPPTPTEFLALPVGKGSPSESPPMKRGNSTSTRLVSQHDQGAGGEPGAVSPPPKPVRKQSRIPDKAKPGEKKAKDKRRSLPPRQPSPVKPPKTVPVTIAEGSILEVPDDASACSDITDAFSLEQMDTVPLKKNTRPKSLSMIAEKNTSDHGGGTSWGELSHTGGEKSDDNKSEFSRERRMHLAKRWQSTPEVRSTQGIAPQSPRRGTDLSEGPKLFAWLKNPFKKSKKGLS